MPVLAELGLTSSHSVPVVSNYDYTVHLVENRQTSNVIFYLEAQLSQKWADRTTYIRRPASDFAEGKRFP